MARPSSASIISCALLTAATANCSPTMWRRATCQRRAPGAAGTNTGCWPKRSGMKSVRMSIGKWRPTSGSRTGFLNRPYASFRTRPLLINQGAWIQARLMSAMLAVAAPKRTSRRGRPNATRRFDWQKPHRGAAVPDLPARGAFARLHPVPVVSHRVSGNSGGPDRRREQEQRTPPGGKPLVPRLDDLHGFGDIGLLRLVLLAALRLARSRFLALQCPAVGGRIGPARKP